VLDIGAGGMNSSFEMLRRGANRVYVIDRQPFGFDGWGENLEVLVRIQARRYGIDRERIQAYNATIGEENPEIPKVSQAYFFFPYPDMLMSAEGLKPIIEYAGDHLTFGGALTIITEIPREDIMMPMIRGLEGKIRTIGGKEPLIFYYKTKKHLYRIRPIVSRSLTEITYGKQ